MPKTKVAVTLDTKLVSKLDGLVREDHFPNRSQAIEAALAEEGLKTELDAWPAY